MNSAKFWATGAIRGFSIFTLTAKHPSVNHPSNPSAKQRNVPTVNLLAYASLLNMLFVT